MLLSFLSLILKGVRYRPLRSWLTVLGVIIGIMLVVIIMALSSGITSAITSRLNMFGSNWLVIFPGKESNPLIGFAGGARFRDSDTDRLKNLPGVDMVIPEDVDTLNVEFRGEKKTALVHATSWKGMRYFLEQAQGFRLEAGQWPLDENEASCVLSSGTAKSLFKEPVKVGDEIILKSRRMKVAGIFAPIGEQMSDNLVYTSLSKLREITGHTGSRSINIMTKPGVDFDLLAKQVRHEMEKQDVVRDFSVLTPQKATRLIGDVLGIITSVLLVIALVSLLVGAVGITNTMYTSVTERTKQIGVMKAIGASRESILSLFLIESGLIGAVGGLSGILIGLLMAWLIGLIFGYMGVPGVFSLASLDFFGFVSLLIFTFITGIVAGYMPARTASRLEPAEALRYE
jgi:putative ABC transport system permease protein